MTVRSKTILAVILTLFFILTAIFFISTRTLQRFSEDQEKNIMQANVSRAYAVLAEEIVKLDMFAYDYAAWNDTYQYMVHRNLPYIESNYSDEGFKRNKFSYVLLVDPAGRVVFSKGYDLQYNREKPVPDDLMAAFSGSSRLLVHKNVESVIKGILVQPASIVITSVRPILTSEYKGPARGTLVMARELDEAVISDLNRKTGLTTALYRLFDSHTPREIQSIRPLLTQKNSINTRFESQDQVAGYMLIDDVYQGPSLVLRVTGMRILYQQYLINQKYFLLVFLITGLLCGVLLVVFLETNVLSRLSALAGFVSSVRSTDNLSARIKLPGSDELSQLAQSVNGMLALLENDVAEQKLAEENIRRQFGKLEALHTIDKAVAGKFDRQTTLNVVLEQVVTQLGVDAADILLYNQERQILEFTAARGFKTSALQHTRLQIGEGHAGRAAYEQTVIIFPGLQADSGAFSRAPLFVHEGFIGYVGAPLFAKGQVVGVLEIFHRSPLTMDQEWIEFLQILSGQAAIAINNADLITNLQISHTELREAYDATIEGWSRALDLRDRETEGHSLRVTDMTVRLARAVGMAEADIVHVRRGSLLHDIGKMGIPDNILLKPDTLTDQEWVIMKKHPRYAYEMLSPITYLRKALAIPYAHHEKWDGSGYPRGLKGEQIPLSARIFAIVDVWDALTSDRPYRLGWPEEKAMEHIRSLAGAHFEPRLVEVFARLFGTGGPA